MSELLACWKCGSLLKELILPMSRREQCANCHADEHVCKMCKHYRPQHSIFCDEERAEPPTELEIANFCDYFEPRMAAEPSAKSKIAAAKTELEALFGGETQGDIESAGGIGTDRGIGTGGAPPNQSKKQQALEDLNKLFADKPNGDT